MTPNAKTKSLWRLATVAVVGIGIITIVLLVAPHARSTTALPSVPASVAQKLRSGYSIYVRSLPAGTRLEVSKSAAEVTAMKEFGRRLTHRGSAFAGVATDKEVTQRQPDGKMRPEMSNRPVWVVLIPDYSMLGYHGMTLSVFVDARTGQYLSAVTIPPG